VEGPAFPRIAPWSRLLPSYFGAQVYFFLTTWLWIFR